MNHIHTESPKRGKNVILVDDEDFEYLNQFKWFISKSGYAGRNSKTINGKRHEIKMHREIMKADGRWNLVDHIDHNPLNNQKSNLRICTHQQNIFNKKPNGVSKYKGVHPYTSIKRGRNKDGSDYVWNAWRAKIRINQSVIPLGLFKNEADAAIAYNEAAKKHFGEFAYLNVI